MNHSPQEITSLVGREVYSNNGVYVGEIEDVRLDLDAEGVSGLAVRDVNTELFDDMVADARGVMLPYRWVLAVGDVVLINDAVERLQSTQDDEEVLA